MPDPSTQDVTQMLKRWGDGDNAELEELTPIISAELHKIARRYIWAVSTAIHAAKLLV